MAIPPIVAAFDSRADQQLASLRNNPAANRVAYLASEIADYSMGWHILGVAVSIANPTLIPHTLRMAITLGVESALVNGAIKPLVKRERPTDWENVAGHGVRRPKTHSFPSGHSSSGVVAASLLSAAVPTARPLWWTLTAIVAWSRLHTRMHHASDIVAGAGIGWLIARAAKRLWVI
ncbi:MAG: phosphatase PAP2 family protein [Acidimicrobiales bacterium]